jgi:hypothetical protein
VADRHNDRNRRGWRRDEEDRFDRDYEFDRGGYGRYGGRQRDYGENVEGARFGGQGRWQRDPDDAYDVGDDFARGQRRGYGNEGEWGREWDRYGMRPDFGRGRMHGSEDDWDRGRMRGGMYGRDRDWDRGGMYGQGDDWGRSRMRGGMVGQGDDWGQGRMRGGMYGRSGDWEQDRRDWGRGRMDFDEDWDDWDDFDDTTTWTYTEYWFVPGPFTGRGPAGYQKSDDRIREEINERLTHHGQIDASKLEVDVNNGEVMLKGEVEDRRTKRLAEDIACSIMGVDDIQNQIRVKRRDHEQDREQQQRHGEQHRQTEQNQGEQQREGQTGTRQQAKTRT